MLLRKYQSNWANDFNRIAESIKEELGEIDHTIEHVGSTAVKGLASKPIIDIDLVYKKQDSFIDIKSSLERLGYFYNGNQGIEGREVFKRDKLKKTHLVLDAINHHLYVCQADSIEVHSHLIFRGFLRRNENAKN